MSLRSHFDDAEIPALNSIFKCEVVNLQDYGAFLKIPGYRKNGLLHKQQISKNEVSEVSEVLSKGDQVWCKVISVGNPEDPKIALSMKVVDQGSGEDLDPAGVQIALDERKRKEHSGHGSRKITLEAVFNTVCKKCGTKGHLSQDCFNKPGSKTYELLSDESEDDGRIPPKIIKLDVPTADVAPPSPKVNEDVKETTKREKKPKKAHKKDKKKRNKSHKHKKKHKR